MQYQIYFQYELVLPHDQGKDQVHVKARLIQPRLSIFSAPDRGLTAVSSHNRAPLVYPSAHQADPTVRTSELRSCDKAQFCTDHGYKYFAFQGRCDYCITTVYVSG